MFLYLPLLCPLSSLLCLPLHFLIYPDGYGFFPRVFFVFLDTFRLSHVLGVHVLGFSLVPRDNFAINRCYINQIEFIELGKKLNPRNSPKTKTD